MKHRTRKRLLNHLFTVFLAVVSAFLIGYFLPSIYSLFSSNAIDANRADDIVFRISLSLGYVALFLLLFTLLIGIWNLMVKKKSLPIQYDLRRDVGIWAGIFGILHSLVGLFVHFRDKPNSFLYYFIFPPETDSIIPIRFDLFGLANYVGLFGFLLVVLLLAISNDFSLKKLGAKRWKNLQRLNYLFFAFVFAHSIIYAVIEKRPLLLFSIAVLLFLFTFGLQVYGLFKYRKIQKSNNIN